MEIQSFDINKVYALIDSYKQGKLFVFYITYGSKLSEEFIYTLGVCK